MRLSLKRAACRSINATVSTGNPGEERSGGICGVSGPSLCMFFDRASLAKVARIASVPKAFTARPVGCANANSKLNRFDEALNYATYSNLNIRPDREAVLIQLHRVARDRFHGCVTRNMVTSLYIARRRS